MGVATLRRFRCNNMHPRPGRRIVDVDIRHYYHFRLGICRCSLKHCRRLICLRSCRRHATVANQFRVTKRADTMKIAWWWDIAFGIDFRPVSFNEIEFV